MDAELIVLQHHPEAGPSAFAEVLDARTGIAPWRLVDATTQALPDLAGVAALLVMGGPMGVPDAEEHPWMDTELAYLRDAVDRGLPVLGICLGAQLLGAALGGRVERREVPEIGYLALNRTEPGRDDEVIAGWPDGATTLFLHEDEVRDLPPGALVLLEGSEGFAAWSLGSALAVQAHPEVTSEQLATWLELEALGKLLASAGVEADLLLDEARRRERFTVPQGRALVGRWIDGPVRKHLAG